MALSRIVTLSVIMMGVLFTQSTLQAQSQDRYLHPRLILKQTDVFPGAGGKRVAAVGAVVTAGGNEVATIGTLTGGGAEGFLYVADPFKGRRFSLLAGQLGTKRFNLNRFGVGVPKIWPAAARRTIGVNATLLDNTAAVVGHRGVVQSVGDPAVGLPVDANITGIARVDMTLRNQLFWRANWQVQGGGSGSAMYTSIDGTPQNIKLLLKTGDQLKQGTITSLSNHRFSQSGKQHAQVVWLNDGTATKQSMYFNGKILFQRGDPIGNTGEKWDQLWFHDVNSQGHVFMSAFTDGPWYRDSVFTLNGKVVMREGDIIDGIYITPNAEANQTRLDDNGRALSLWAKGGISGPYAIFYTPNIKNFDKTKHLISENTPLDFNGDGIADATLYRFRFFSDAGLTMELGRSGAFISVELDFPNGARRRAIIFVPYPLV